MLDRLLNRFPTMSFRQRCQTGYIVDAYSTRYMILRLATGVSTTLTSPARPSTTPEPYGPTPNT